MRETLLAFPPGSTVLATSSVSIDTNPAFRRSPVRSGNKVGCEYFRMCAAVAGELISQPIPNKRSRGRRPRHRCLVVVDVGDPQVNAAGKEGESRQTSPDREPVAVAFFGLEYVNAAPPGAVLVATGGKGGRSLLLFHGVYLFVSKLGLRRGAFAQHDCTKPCRDNLNDGAMDVAKCHSLYKTRRGRA